MFRYSYLKYVSCMSARCHEAEVDDNPDYTVFAAGAYYEYPNNCRRECKEKEYKSG